jgi:hypothetical protein
MTYNHLSLHRWAGSKQRIVDVLLSHMRPDPQRHNHAIVPFWGSGVDGRAFAQAGHWHYVRRSELRYIVPYIQRVDYIFNGVLPYELSYHRARLADHMPAIVEKFKGDPKKADALLRAERLQRLMAALKSPASTDDVPDDSLLREFIGGSRYHY